MKQHGGNAMQALLVYMTAENADEAEKIGRALVAKRLAACVNIVDGMRAVFWWEGAAQTENETAFLAKTTQERFPALLAEVNRLHSYDTPCVIALPVVAGNPDFIDWIYEETKGDANEQR